MARSWQRRIFPEQQASLLFWSAYNRPWFDVMPQYERWYREWFWDASMRRQVENWRAARENHAQERSRA